MIEMNNSEVEKQTAAKEQVMSISALLLKVERTPLVVIIQSIPKENEEKKEFLEDLG